MFHVRLAVVGGEDFDEVASLYGLSSSEKEEVLGRFKGVAYLASDDFCGEERKGILENVVVLNPCSRGSFLVWTSKTVNAIRVDGELWVPEDTLVDL